MMVACWMVAGTSCGPEHLSVTLPGGTVLDDWLVGLEAAGLCPAMIASYREKATSHVIHGTSLTLVYRRSRPLTSIGPIRSFLRSGARLRHRKGGRRPPFGPLPSHDHQQGTQRRCAQGAGQSQCCKCLLLRRRLRRRGPRSSLHGRQRSFRYFLRSSMDTRTVSCSGITPSLDCVEGRVAGFAGSMWILVTSPITVPPSCRHSPESARVG
jgi:hypothetical protein